ncbi:MAG: rhomboid family intramembrane serine protease [Candidatus Woesearchaeota archaeon]|jgi:rhomboid protease GluP
MNKIYTTKKNIVFLLFAAMMLLPVIFVILKGDIFVLKPFLYSLLFLALSISYILYIFTTKTTINQDGLHRTSIYGKIDIPFNAIKKIGFNNNGRMKTNYLMIYYNEKSAYFFELSNQNQFLTDIEGFVSKDKFETDVWRSFHKIPNIQIPELLPIDELTFFTKAQLKKFIKKNPTLIKFKEALFKIEYNAEQFNSAYKTGKELIQYKKNDYDFIYVYANACMFSDNEKEAKILLKGLLSSIPEHKNASIKLLVLYLIDGEFKEAEEYYNKNREYFSKILQEKKKTFIENLLSKTKITSDEKDILNTDYLGIDYPGDEEASPEIQKESKAFEDFFQRLSEVTPTVYVFYAIIGLNTIVFALMILTGVNIFNPLVSDLMEWGASYNPSVLNGEWWRLITNIFIHIGILHLVLNMWAFYNVGKTAERMFGNINFAFLYLSCGLIASLCSIFVNKDIVGAGASGAIFGIYGAIFGFTLARKNEIDYSVFSTMSKSIIVFVIYNVGYGFSKSGIDNVAHISGLVWGIIGGYILSGPLKQELRTNLIQKTMLYSLLTITMALSMIFFNLKTCNEYQVFKMYLYKKEQIAHYLFDKHVKPTSRELNPITYTNSLENNILTIWTDLENRIDKIDGVQEDSIKEFNLTQEYIKRKKAGLELIIAGIRNNNNSTFLKGVNLYKSASDLIPQIESINKNDKEK